MNKTQARVILMTCPFCGATADVGSVCVNDEMWSYAAAVECTSCLAKIISENEINGRNHMARETRWDYTEVVTAWNRRSALTNDAGEIK